MKLKRRRTVEIYFILYLAALIFLLPKREEEKKPVTEESVSAFTDNLFSIHPLLTTLNCRLYLDSTGSHILSFDSVNTIVSNGNVDNVKYEFIVEDQSLRQKLNLNADNESNRHFGFDENAHQQTATFFWSPPLNEKINKTYIVTATATAYLKSDDNNSIKRKLEAKTQFSLNMIYVNNSLTTQNEYFPLYPSDTSQRFNSQPRIFQAPFTGDIDIKPEMTVIKSIAYQRWTNQINIYGGNFTRDITQKPEIKYVLEPEDNGGSASILIIDPFKIILTGTTPSHGRMKVICTVKTKNKNKELSVDFTVSPSPIRPPEYERYMYPEKTYLISPNLPLLYGKETKAMIRDGNNIRAISEQGDKFYFTPDISDTGKTLTLECYIDGVLNGQKHQITILNYGNPIIYDVQIISNKEVKIITQSYGFYLHKENISILEIDGNANVYELMGKIPESPDNITHVQIFRCIPKYNDRPFVFKVRAKDRRGKYSQTRTINPES